MMGWITPSPMERLSTPSKKRLSMAATCKAERGKPVGAADARCEGRAELVPAHHLTDSSPVRGARPLAEVRHLTRQRPRHQRVEDALAARRIDEGRRVSDKQDATIRKVRPRGSER